MPVHDQEWCDMMLYETPANVLKTRLVGSIMDLNEKRIRDGLAGLGWKPPPSGLIPKVSPPGSGIRPEVYRAVKAKADAARLGIRDNDGKPPISMLLEAKHAVLGASKVFGYGEQKYARSNWRNGLKHTGVADSLLRHLSAYLAGEDVDEESGLRHVDHVTANAIFLAELTVTRPDLDDRGVVPNES